MSGHCHEVKTEAREGIVAYYSRAESFRGSPEAIRVGEQVFIDASREISSKAGSMLPEHGGRGGQVGLATASFPGSRHPSESISACSGSGGRGAQPSAAI